VSAGGGLLARLRGLSASVVALLANRVELAGTELELAARLHAARLVWALAALLLAFLALVFGSLLVLILCWDTHRIAAAVGLAVGYAALGLMAWYRSMALARTAPALLAATVAELRADLAALRGSKS
jgi:uncharacterized membrane protein YqjE